jgi:CRP-like cAMP-binding protein
MSTGEISNNVLVTGLSDEDRDRMRTHLEPVNLTLREVLFRPEEFLPHVYFPDTAIVSLLTTLSDGNGMEVGLVGREGFAGVSAVLGGTETKVGTVQGSGLAWRMDAELLRSEFRRGGKFQGAILRYVHALMAQISQSVVCNTRHPVEGRLARWLLMYHDRLDRDEFEMTQEFMANMLGTRRPSVSEIAGRLQEMGLIRYSRGRIQILDRPGLEQFACECYRVIKEKFDGMLM